MSFDYSQFDTLLEPLFILAEDGKVVYANETALHLCSLPFRKVQKLKFHELLTFSEKIEWCEKLGSIIDPTTYKEVNFTNQEGQEGRVQLTCRKFSPADPDRHWIVYVRDVTLEARLQHKYRGELEQKGGYIEELKKAQGELEQYSKNLEKMVEVRTREITRLSLQMKALLDSLHQGFLIFGADGTCFETSSQACQRVLEGAPTGKAIWDVLRMPENKVDGFKKWMTTMFSEMLPFEDLAPLGPPSFPHSEGHSISIEYFPLRADSGAIEGVVVVASDITSLVEAKKQAELDREHARLIIKLVKNKKEVSGFIREAQTILTNLKNHLEQPIKAWSREEIFRALHTIKGGSASFSVIKTAHLCHQAEQVLADAKGDHFIEQAVSLKEKCLAIESSFEEFILDTKNIWGDKGVSEERTVELPISELVTISQRISTWSQGQDTADDLLKKYMMEPIGAFFAPYKELIQNVADQENKKIKELQILNGDLKILPEIYSSLLSCLVHAFRNAVDHGIEAPELREAAGKPQEGKISVEFNLISPSSSILQIKITDDGGGIDPTKIRNKLIEKGIATVTESDHEVIQRVFDTEFSTKAVATETSGRGVGMDAILISALTMGGTAWVDSVVGQGTTLTIEVPYLQEQKLPLTPPTAPLKCA